MYASKEFANVKYNYYLCGDFLTIDSYDLFTQRLN